MLRAGSRQRRMNGGLGNTGRERASTGDRHTIKLEVSAALPSRAYSGGLAERGRVLRSPLRGSAVRLLGEHQFLPYLDQALNSANVTCKYSR